MRQTVGFLGFSSVDLQLVSKPRLDAFVFRVYSLMRAQHWSKAHAVERLLYGW